MSVTFPRLLGVLAVVWLVILQYGLLDWPSTGVWALYLAVWVAMTALLLAARAVRVAGIAMAMLAAVLLLGPAPQLVSATAMWLWMGVILAVSDTRPAERALLVRTFATSVYAFAAVTKLNPSFLAGEQVRALVVDRAHWSGLVPIMDSWFGLVASWGAIAVEAWIPVGLWWAPARRATVALGILFHAVLVVIAFQGTRWDLAYITVLNGMLVVSYVAFFHPIRPAWARDPDGLPEARLASGDQHVPGEGVVGA